MRALCFDRRKSKANYSVVSIASRAGLDPSLNRPWPTDHFSEIGYDLDMPNLTTSFPYEGAFDRVVARAVASRACSSA